MADATRANTKRIKNTVTVPLPGQTEESTMEAGRTESKMEMGFIRGAMEREEEVSGVREGGFSGIKIRSNFDAGKMLLNVSFFIFGNY